MGFMDLFIRSDINAGVKKCQADPEGVLVDVREPQEYEHHRIPGSVNLPLSLIDTVTSVYPDRAKHLYVYCYSGAKGDLAQLFIGNVFGKIQVFDQPVFQFFNQFQTVPPGSGPCTF